MAEVDSSTRRFPLSEYQQRANSPRPEFEDCLMGASIAKRFGYLHEDRPQEAFSAQVASFRMKLGRGDVDGGGDGAAGIGVGISDIYARDRHYYPAQ